MSVDEEGDLVEVLYDYSYADDSGTVTINVGDTYTLLEKTNQEWWQVVRSTDDESESFFVPAQYVRIIPQEDDGGIYSNREAYLRKDVNGQAAGTTPPGRGNRWGSQEDLTQPRSDGRIIPNVLSLKNDDRGPNEEVVYANLEELRAGLPLEGVKDSQQLQPCEYANVAMGPDEEGLPQPQEGDKGRRLVDYLPWFIYNECGPGRPFYINSDTGETTYKPPRHKNQRIAEKLSPTFPKMFTDSPGDSSPKEVTIQTEYEEVKEDGKLFYVHKNTNDKYERIKNESGSQYFFHVKSGESFWELPSHSPRFHNGDTVDENRNRNLSQSLRMSKAKSMCENIDFMKGDPSAIKAHTLPMSFSYGSKTGDQLCGLLNKAKMGEVGKKGKKVKKNWSQSYVVLHLSNIIFYKDQKASINRPGSPHGKPELVISLQGATVDFSQCSDVSSKRNVITLTSGNNTQYLLQADDESYARKWFFRLKVAADDIQEKKKQEQKQAADTSLMRSQSVDDAQAGAERHASLNATFFRMRDKLLSLISRRPTQEDLIKRGIIKEGVFGAHLKELCAKEHNTVPTFVKKCIAAVEHKGLDHDGLYRVSGNLAEIQKLRYMVDKDDSYSLDGEDLDIHVLTGSLKLFFRELKEPLFPFFMFDRFTAAIKKEKNSQRLRAFKDLMAELPKCNHDTMKVLFHHLKKVIDNSHLNRMQTQNVAIVFGPTLMWSDCETMGMAVMTIMQSRVVEYILLEYDSLFL